MPFVPDDDTATATAPAPTGGRFVPDAPPAPQGPQMPNGQTRVVMGPDGVPTTTSAAYAAPPPPPSMVDKVTSAVQAGVNIATSMAGGILGSLTGTARSVYQGAATVAGDVQRKVQGLPPQTITPTPGLEQNQADDAQAIGSGLKRMVSGPMDLNEPQTPDSPLTEQYTDAAQPVADNLMAASGLHGTMGPPGALQAGADAVRGMAGATPEAALANAGLAKAGEVMRQGARSVLNVDPELAKVARTAGDLKYPIDVRPDQIVDGAKYTKLAGEASASVPLSGSTRSSNQVAYTRNLIDMLNPDDVKSDRLTPDVFAAAMDRSGSGIGDITARTPVPMDSLEPGLRSIDLSKATEENQRIVTSYIDDIKKAATEGDGTIDGTRLKEINSQLGKQARSNAGNDLGRYLNDLQDTVQGAVEENAAPEDVQPLRDFRRQYAYGKIVEPLVAKTIDGKVSPSALMGAVTATKQGKNYMARAMGGPIGDLAKVGKLIQEPGSSNTAERGLVLGALGGGAAIEPHTAAAAYAGANVYNRLGPKVVQALVRDRSGAAPAADVPPEPGTTLGAADEDHPPQGGAPASPLGDLTPDWSTSAGVNGPARPGEEPGLVQAHDEIPSNTSPGAAPPAAPGSEIPVHQPAPLGDHTPMWTTSEGAGGTATRAEEPGLVTAEPTHTPFVRSGKRAGEQIPAVPGRPDLPDTVQAGPMFDTPANTRGGNVAASDADNIALGTPGAQQAMRNAKSEREAAARAEIPTGEATELSPEQVAALETPKRGEIPTPQVMEGQPDIAGSAAPKSIPAGKVVEGQPSIPGSTPPAKIPAGKATEITPEVIELGRKWQRDFGMGDDDAMRAHAVARAFDHDPEAVAAAATSLDNNPAAFDREIARINLERTTNEDAANSAIRSGKGDASGAAKNAVVPENGGQGGIDAGAGGGQGSGAPGGAEAPVQQAGKGGPVSTSAAVRTGDVSPGNDGAAAPGADQPSDQPAGGQAESGWRIVADQFTKRVRDSDGGMHTVVKLPDGSIRRITRLNRIESMGLPGWHDMDTDGSSYLGDTEADAVKALVAKGKK